jgi:S1-C subfamily serine protease
MAIEWRLYSQPLKRVVATTHTSAVRKLNGHDLKLETVLNDAFVDSLRQLALAAPIRAALAAPSQAKAESVLPAAQPSITLAGSLAAPPRGMSTAADSVVLVLVAEGHGSGFLVSKDGYFLTDAHVVESAKTVKIRWSDGVTDEAQVVRVDKGRDVALLKADPRGHAPLALRPQMPDVGETVFAIGAPLDKNLQGTVMRGIVSAHRVKDGYDLLQSDVAANMGMSGGPLLDAQGRVVALVESGYQPTAEVQVGINYFTPVGDALKYLSLAPQ